MKFTDGYWNMREGYKVLNATEVRDIAVASDSMTVYASCQPVRRRGDTLNAPLITLRYSSPIPDVICVRITHFSGKKKRGPEFRIQTGNTAVQSADEAGEASFSSGDLSVKIRKTESIKTDFLYQGKRLTGTGGKTTG